MKSPLFVVCWLAALGQFHSRAADTNPADEWPHIYRLMGTQTKLVNTGEWSQPVTGGHATKISGRILVYDGGSFTDETGSAFYIPAPVFVESTNETTFPTQIFFNWVKDVHFELRGLDGKPADNLRVPAGGVSSLLSAQWADVPAMGDLRLRANRDMAMQYFAMGGPPIRQNPDDLYLCFSQRDEWLIRGGDTNAYFLSATFSSQPTNSSPGSNAVWQATLEFPRVELSRGKH